jgi:outer membrane protein, heavy metal efflux system
MMINKILKDIGAKLPLWGLGGLFFLCSIFSYSQTLDDYLQMAAENNPQVKSAYSQFEAAMQQAPQVASLPDPTLTMSAFGRMIETRLGAQEARFSLMQMFPWFGTLKAKEDAAVLRADAKFQQYLDARNEVFFNIKSVYAELYALEETIKIRKENLEILDSYRDLALSRFKSGNAPMVNVVKTDIQREAAKTEIELMEDQRRPLLIRLNLMLSRDPGAAVKVEDTLTFPAAVLGGRNEELFERHPMVSALEKQQQAYEMEKVIADKEGMPMVGLGVDYSIISKRTDANPPMNGQDAIMPMVSVTLPIFRKRVRAAKREAELMAEGMGYEQEAVINELQGRLSGAQYQLSRAQKLLDLYERQLESTSQANTLLISAFSNATGDFEEVLQMNQDILTLETQRVEAIKEGFTAQAEIEYLFSITE